jgi:asparagine synthase (glutamine-hydrolysing)
VCGIVGFLSRGPVTPETLPDLGSRACQALRHRGPDDSGVWSDPESGVVLGHTRLAIIDLSPQGRQPMTSACGRYVIVFNGEVYNHLDLRRELEERGDAPHFRGHSDTEVMLAAIAAWGLERALPRFMGMFAFGLWDRRDRTLHLVRDRMGIKPIYYGEVGGRFAFASELKAFRVTSDLEAEVDRNVLALYLRHNYIPDPYSIYTGIFKLQPGTILTVRRGGTTSFEQKTTTYWSAREVWEAGAREPFDGNQAEAVEALEELLKDSVRLRMIADVPLGAFLSGGIDSSLVVALMQSMSTRPVRTFTIGFHEAGHDEAKYARQVARYLGSDHTELYVTPQEAMAIIPELPNIYDEPFADASQIPTYLVSRLARQSVTVALSGDGGDELFAGYNHYRIAHRYWSMTRRIPYCVRRVIGAAAHPLYRVLGEQASRFAGFLLGSSAPKKLEYGLSMISIDDFRLFYRGVVSHLLDPGTLVRGGVEPTSPFDVPDGRPEDRDLYRVMALLDLRTYLPGDILTKLDRASMSVALEARVPLLDHRVVEFAGRLPVEANVEKGRGKMILRRLLHRYIPAELVERPKMGFAVPMGSWLAGPLRPWAQDLLDEQRLRRDGYFDAGKIGNIWKEHVSGRRSRGEVLWGVLMFQAWLERQTAVAER